ncbi:MAG: FHA domain-containing protein [Actinomycetota bacterium]|jgi:pSer/pThr/pTyr-binding forkhead associated (FHA) protein|nr:FHA domain-containing protein [Actinomycetota bacterium]
MDLQVPILAAKALLLLLLFAFIYAVIRRGIGDLRSVPEDETFVPGGGDGVRRDGSGAYDIEDRNGFAALVVEDSDVLAPNTRFSVESGTTSIGRSSASDIVLKNDDYASGRHARLTRHGGLLYVEDIDSTNGTYVNGRKAIGATPLRSGDRVRVGSTTFRYSG